MPPLTLQALILRAPLRRKLLPFLPASAKHAVMGLNMQIIAGTDAHRRNIREVLRGRTEQRRRLGIRPSPLLQLLCDDMIRIRMTGFLRAAEEHNIYSITLATLQAHRETRRSIRAVIRVWGKAIDRFGQLPSAAVMEPAMHATGTRTPACAWCLIPVHGRAFRTCDQCHGVFHSACYMLHVETWRALQDLALADASAPSPLEQVLLDPSLCPQLVAYCYADEEHHIYGLTTAVLRMHSQHRKDICGSTAAWKGLQEDVRYNDFLTAQVQRHGGSPAARMAATVLARRRARGT
jgi:hypothetical protein